MSQEFKCAICGGTYSRIWTDEEAMEECQSYFGDVQQKDCFIVCDDCYQVIHPTKFPNWTRALKAGRMT